MENAKWGEKRISAHEIAKDYQVEKLIRRASSKGELICTDSGCKHPILRYCHGAIKGPFFAHRINSECDYEQWEKTHGNYHDLRVKLYEHFKSHGYSVQMEVKVLKHHYSHLLFEGKDGRRTALEIGDKSMNIKTIEKLSHEYKNLGMSVAWIEIGEARKYVEEDRTYFFERFCLNENNKCLLIINQETNEVAQYKVDMNPYIYRGQQINSKNYPRVFSYLSTFSDLRYENKSLTLKGFEEAYEEFITKKQKAFEKYVKEEDEKRRFLNEHRFNHTREKNDNKFETKREVFTLCDVSNPSLFSATNKPVYCILCGKLKTEREIAVRGGDCGGPNKGKCKECMKDGRK